MDKQKASEKRYRESHREERNEAARKRRAVHGDQINARRRANRAERLYRGTKPGEGVRHAYYLELKARGYYASPARKEAERIWRENGRKNCTCGAEISRHALHCKACAALKRAEVLRGRRRTKTAQAPNPTHPNCPYCFTEMRAMRWHGTDFWRCGACGLETTPLEVSRFVYEEEIAA